MKIPLTRPLRPLARQFPEQKVTFRGTPTQEIKFCTNKAGMYMKTNRIMTSCPRKSRTFSAFAWHLSDILAAASAKQQSNFLIGGANDRHKRGTAKPVWAGGGLANSFSRPGADRSYDRECVSKAPQSAAVGSANDSLEPTICQKRKTLRRETG